MKKILEFTSYMNAVIQNMACIIENVHYFVEPEIGNITGYEKNLYEITLVEYLPCKTDINRF